MQLDHIPSTLDHPNAFVYIDYDELGDRRVVVVQQPPVPIQRMRVLARTVDTRADRLAVWQMDPCCMECECWISSPDSAAIVATDVGPRLACRIACFGAAMVKHHPGLSIRAALHRAVAR